VVSKLEDHLGYWLRCVSNQVSHAFSQRVQTHGVTVAEWVVLRELYDRSMLATELAESLGMTRGAISKLGTRLVEKNLLEKQPRLHKSRAEPLILTSEGRRLVPILARLADENDLEFFASLTDSERNQILNSFKTLAERLGIRSVPID